MATGGHCGFWLLTNSAAIFARVMGANFFSKYFKELKSSVKLYYALSGHGTPRLHPTNTSDSHQIPSQNKTKSKLKKFKFWKFSKKTLHATHLLKLLDKMYKYEKDPTRTVGATGRTRDAGGMDRQTDGVKPIYLPTTSLYKYQVPVRHKHRDYGMATIHGLGPALLAI